ncbi:MAG: hypothetical protein JNJ73_06005 [Hyphomonadaceae bacterium]|nr:hypothetical protein [Hyphomonadaceae bacterium]
MLGIGLDYALKHYVLNEEEEEEPERSKDPPLDQAFEKTLIAAHAAVEAERHGKSAIAERPFIEFLCEFSLLKAMQTLDSAHTLAHQGRLFEASVLTRSAIEKLAYSAAMTKAEVSQAPLELTTRHAITLVRTDLPAIPRLYGLLSKFAHWQREVHLMFFGPVQKPKLFGLLDVPWDNDGAPGQGVYAATRSHKAAGLVLAGCATECALQTFCVGLAHFRPALEFPLSTAALQAVRQITDAAIAKILGATELDEFIHALAKTRK